MPITYHIDPIRNLVITHAVGTLTDEDILTHKRKLAADSGFRPGMGELSDVRGITDLRVTADGVRAMVEADASQASNLQGYRLAIVAGQDVVFGMARMYELLVERHLPHVNVFRSCLDAARWLNVAPVDEDAAATAD